MSSHYIRKENNMISWSTVYSSSSSSGSRSSGRSLDLAVARGILLGPLTKRKKNNLTLFSVIQTRFIPRFTAKKIKSNFSCVEVNLDWHSFKR